MHMQVVTVGNMVRLVCGVWSLTLTVRYRRYYVQLRVSFGMGAGGARAHIGRYGRSGVGGFGIRVSASTDNPASNSIP
eukprot:6763349-Prymnesium_polylepis.1